MKNAVNMTVEEFALELKTLSKKVLDYKAQFENGKVDKRKFPRSTRHYQNAKRGNFQGSSNWLTLNPSMHSSKNSMVRQAVNGLNELRNSVDTGSKQNISRIER
jgi:hypothetical protein